MLPALAEEHARHPVQLNAVGRWARGEAEPVETADRDRGLTHGSARVLLPPDEARRAEVDRRPVAIGLDNPSRESHVVADEICREQCARPAVKVDRRAFL